jgi:hypothetical protein
VKSAAARGNALWHQSRRSEDNQLDIAQIAQYWKNVPRKLQDLRTWESIKEVLGRNN